MTASPGPIPGQASPPPGLLADGIQLGKPRISTLVLVSTALGYLLGSTPPFRWGEFLALLGGTLLVSWGIHALNQVLERDTDRLMPRTRDRPLAAGRLPPGPVRIAGLAATVAGLAVLLLGTNPPAAAIALVVAVIYVGIYTPLKRITRLNTLVGAVPGALPAPLGWVAARGTLELEAWSLFLIMFIWQLPHFLPIAWLYRNDFRQAGLAMISVDDPRGGSTRRQLLLYTATLVLVSLNPTVIGMAGTVYFAGALALGVGFFVAALAMALHLTDDRARMVLRVSVLYLPLLLCLLVYDATPR
jgi:protoheme IX farnesyltransferase